MCGVQLVTELCVCVRAWREVFVCVTQFGKKDLSNDTPIGQNSKRTVR